MTGKAIRDTIDGESDPQGAEKDASERTWYLALLQFWEGQFKRVTKRVRAGASRARKAADEQHIAHGALLSDVKAADDLDVILAGLDKTFWDAETRQLLAVLLPLIEGDAAQAAEMLADMMLDVLELGVDYGLVNEAAAQWAEEYSSELVRSITDTTRASLRRAVAGWLRTPGATIGDLTNTIAKSPTFSGARAHMIAITEVTRAYSEGNMAAARIYEDEGLLQWRKIWRTNMDNLVCDICRPLNNMPVEGIDGERQLTRIARRGGQLVRVSAGVVRGPPAHPRCRCWETYVPVLLEE